jgi:hypothetical protein
MKLKDIIQNYKIKIGEDLCPLPEGWVWTKTYGGVLMAFSDLFGGVAIIDGQMKTSGAKIPLKVIKAVLDLWETTDGVRFKGIK